MGERVEPAEIAALLRSRRRIVTGVASQTERAEFAAWKASVLERVQALADEQAEHEANIRRGL